MVKVQSLQNLNEEKGNTMNVSHSLSLWLFDSHIPAGMYVFTIIKGNGFNPRLFLLDIT